MSEIQILTLVASLLGILGGLANLVTFAREKEKGHKKAVLILLTLLVTALSLLLLPRYAPQFAARCVAALPQNVRPHLSWWVAPAAAAPLPATTLHASFSLEVDRNLLGGTSALQCLQRFSNTGNTPVRVHGFEIEISPALDGSGTRKFSRVLAEPVLVPSAGTLDHKTELDEEIRNAWFDWSHTDPANRGGIRIRWQAQDAQGHLFETAAHNG